MKDLSPQLRYDSCIQLAYTRQSSKYPFLSRRRVLSGYEGTSSCHFLSIRSSYTMTSIALALPPSFLNDTIGALHIGFGVSCALFGILTTQVRLHVPSLNEFHVLTYIRQVYLYFRKYSNDSRTVIVLVRASSCISSSTHGNATGCVHLVP